MRIDVWSDVVCPWCYIGKRRLEQALAESGDTAEIVWHSFQLDPSSTNDDPRDLATRLGEKYGRGREWPVARRPRRDPYNSAPGGENAVPPTTGPTGT